MLKATLSTLMKIILFITWHVMRWGRIALWMLHDCS